MMTTLDRIVKTHQPGWMSMYHTSGSVSAQSNTCSMSSCSSGVMELRAFGRFNIRRRTWSLGEEVIRWSPVFGGVSFWGTGGMSRRCPSFDGSGGSEAGQGLATHHGSLECRQNKGHSHSLSRIHTSDYMKPGAAQVCTLMPRSSGGVLMPL